MLLNKTQELDIIRAGTVGNVRIIDHAAADLENPVKPNKPLVVIVATLLGALLATAFVYVREALKRGVENPEDIERTGTPVASIPSPRSRPRWRSAWPTSSATRALHPTC